MILYGAGGHARVIFESLQECGSEVSGVIDDNPGILEFKGLSVRHGYSADFFKEFPLIIAIGDNHIRADLSAKVLHRFGILKDRTSLIARSSSICKGSVALMGSAIQSGCVIGEHVIINTRALVEHDCQIDNYAHIGPGSVVCGGVSIGEGALIGANATILPGVSIGDWAIVGAGSVVLSNIPAGAKYVGNPAKPISIR